MQKSLNAKKQHISLSELALMGFYGVVLFAIYYRTDEYINLGSLQLRERLIYSMVLVGFALVHFLVKTDLRHGARTGMATFVLLLPSVILIFTSVPIWVIEAVDPSTMRRGIIDQLYDIGMIAAMGGLIYVFRKKAFVLNMTAALLAYLLKLMQIIADNGLVPFLNEFRTLVLTFADETGPIMEAAELHEPTFCMGILLIGAALIVMNNKKDWLMWIELALGAFCFLTGFKRITVLAAAASAALGAVLLLITKRGTKRMWLVHLSAFMVVLACFAYLVFIKFGLFDYLEKMGVNTMGRAWLSYQVDGFYSLSPLFLGHGTGFISRFMSDVAVNIKALHNGPLQIYIDNGFWGFALWGLAFLPLRTRHIAKHSSGKASIAALCCSLTLIITALTDNTIFYADVAGALAMVIMYYALEVETA